VVFDINAILDLMPHRYPFLLIDRITEFDHENRRIIGYKNITFNEPCFTGHFPGRPIFPGVLIMEAMAQTGCVLLTAEGVDSKKQLVFFTGMNNVKFRKTVTIARYRMGIVHLVAKAYVNDQLVAEGDLSAAVVNREVA
jgi:UDP-3-O-[3-hydroxymyristoyl] N-acetylglucosamine deacetylase / 3-hydroxyacyl-[acyl-carrier-protein] dehydratase